MSRPASQRSHVRRDPATGVAASHHAGGDRLAVVTGSEGFIGRHLVRRLSAEGWRVRAVDLSAPERAAPGSGASKPEAADPGPRQDPAPEPAVSRAVDHHRADVRDEEAMAGALAGADTVFHLASAHLEHGAPEEWYRSVNVDGARSVARIAARAGVRRLVHTSSVGIYGHVQNPPADEDAPKAPSNPYERTKLLGEEAVLDTADEEGLEVLVLRPGWVYGPGCRRTEKLLRAVRRRRFAFVGDGSNLRHPLHISDMLDAFLLAADAPSGAVGGTYLVVGPRALSVRELVRVCARVQGVPEPKLRLPRPLVSTGLRGVEFAFRLVGRTPPVSRRSLAFFENDNAFTGQAAAEALGFEPRVGLEEGLRATLDAPEVAA